MTEPQTIFCVSCGHEDESWRSFCANCGRPLDFGRSGAARVPGIAFLLNEARTPRLQRLVPAPALGELTEQYRAELATLTGRAPGPAVAHEPPPRRTRRQAEPAAEASASAPRPTIRPVPAPPPPARPREPHDWSWLADQQANLFLFAGAFLVVVAALIYVAYSGQAISGALKMSLLAGYTVAFLVAGVLCLRVSRVRMAGQVFFGVGALLVPLNFVAAYNIFSGSHLSPEAIWLAGSLTTACFYSAVAATGLGRHYAYSAGVAMISAVGAAVAIAALPFVWAPVAFLALAAALSLGDLAAPSWLRTRVTFAWLIEAHVVAVAAAIVALGCALTLALAPVHFDDVPHWFLLPAAALALAFYGTDVVVRGRRAAMPGACMALAVVAGSVVFGARLAPEHYALALIAAGAVTVVAARLAVRLTRRFGYASIAVGAHAAGAAGEGARAPLPRFGYASRAVGARSVGAAGEGARGPWQRFGSASIAVDATAAALAMITAGAGVAIVSVLEASNPDVAYARQSHWSLFAAFASACAAYALCGIAGVTDHDDELPVIGFAATLTGAATAVVYGAGWSAEYYAFAFLAAAGLLLAISLVRAPIVAGIIRPAMRRHTMTIAHLAAIAGALIMLGAVYAAAVRPDYELQTRWSVAALFGALAVFCAAATLLHRPESGTVSRGATLGGTLASVFGVTLGAVYAVDVSAEYYAFALLVPALALAMIAWIPDAAIGRTTLAARLPSGWRNSLLVAGRIAVAAGIAVTVAAVFAARAEDLGYRPDSGVFVPVAFLVAAAFFALDVARRDGQAYATSAALLASLAGAGLGVTYAAGAGAQWYGVTFACIGATYGFGLRAWAPAWLDADAREHAALVAVTTAWVAFEQAYAGFPHIAVGVHFTAAAFYVMQALGERRRLSVGGRAQAPAATSMSIAPAWLYAAALAIAIGYIDALRTLPAADDAGAGSIAFPLFALAVVFAAAGAAMRRWRPDFRLHLYTIALALDIAAVAAAHDAHALALLLTVSAAVPVALALVDDDPALGLPALVASIGAVIAWQQAAHAPAYTLPIAYATIALATYALGFACRSAAPAWSAALRVAGVTHALLAPAAGFVALGYSGNEGVTSAVYQWSTLAVALAGLLALIESSIARRGWVVVMGSGVLLVAVLLEVAHFQPASIQAYTVVIGVYLLLLGTLGLWRFRLIPEARDLAPYAEALGAVVIMLPSFAQSFDGGRYALILLAEAVAFFSAGVTLRRRGMLATAVTAMVLVAARVLFDAINALPNWIVVLIAGMALLAAGMGILLGRERWARWQRALLSWWDAMSLADDAR